MRDVTSPKSITVNPPVQVICIRGHAANFECVQRGSNTSVSVHNCLCHTVLGEPAFMHGELAMSSLLFHHEVLVQKMACTRSRRHVLLAL